ncbi:MAG: hypothetical protein MUO72_03990 [Bacteroidales bacterium]|nr:hypothetical protein [Bacteroidales bacterium]
MKKSDLISDLIIEGDLKRIKQEPLDNNNKTKPKRSKWFKWFRIIIDFIVDVFS